MLIQQHRDPAVRARPIGPIAWALEPLPPIQELRRAWTPIDTGDGPGFFISWSWIGTWLAKLPAELEPLLLRGSIAGRGTALGIIIRRHSRRRKLISSNALHLNSTGDPDMDCITIEHNGLAAPPHLESGLSRSLLDWFARQQLDADELYLSGVTLPLPQMQGGPESSLASVVRRTYEIDLDLLGNVGGDFAARLSRNARQQLRHALRMCEEHGPLRLEEAKTVDEALVFFEGLKHLHIQSWTRRQKPHSFLKPFFETFHHALIREGMPKGEIQLLRISAGDGTIGYLYNFRHKKRIYAYQSGFDDSISRWRPGYVSHYLAINYNYREGMTCYDLLAGDNRLKQSFATNVYDMYWHRLYRPLLRFRVENSLHRVKNRYLLGSASSGQRALQQ